MNYETDFLKNHQPKQAKKYAVSSLPKPDPEPNYHMSNDEMIDLIKEYQATKDDDVFTDIYLDVAPMAQKIGIFFYNTKGSFVANAMAEDFMQVAQQAILRAVTQYDTEKRSPFNKFLKQNIEWALHDEFIKKSFTQKSQLHTQASHMSIDRDFDGLTGLDLLGDKHSTDSDEVHNSAFSDDSTSFGSENYMDQVKTLLADFKTAHPEESEMISLLFKIALKDTTATDRQINKYLFEEMPEHKPATVRQRKKRAIDRLLKFADENGFESLNMSQF